MPHSTLKLGAATNAADVRAWQTIVGAPVDGKFGPTTEAATRDWQRKHGLVADGVVGPVSWATAEGKTVPAVKTAQAPADLAAYEVAKRADPSMPEPLRQYALAVARGEGFYGHGWANPNPATIAESEKFGLTGYEGKGSNNWGAVQGSGSAGSFKHVDHHADGSVYVGNYRKWKTPEEGFLDTARVLFGGGTRDAAGAAAIREAIEAGDLKRAVNEQHANGYFELDPAKYFAAVQRNYGVLTANVGWRPAFGAAVAAGGAALAAVAAVAVGVGYLLTRART